MRKFAFPHTRMVSVDDYLRTLSKYGANIDNIYFGLPSNLNVINLHVNKYIESPQVLKQEDNHVVELLDKSYGRFKRVALYNPIVFAESNEALRKNAEEQIIPFLKRYKVEALVITHFYIAQVIKQAIPEIEIQTSCNSYQFAIPQMLLWKGELGVELFNPPREALRMPSLLKQMKDAGLKVKGIVNQSCLMGCPFTILDGALTVQGCRDETFSCHLNKPENFFKGNFIIPRWLPQLDEYVDVYKIVGRGMPFNMLLDIFESYLKLDETVSVNSLVLYCGTTTHQKEVQAKNIPDKLLTCECLDCEECKLCNVLAEQYL
ncbi:MAG: peptidase [Firmicutes bacterium]|nr:peptidase [Bacillota bacterium]